MIVGAVIDRNWDTLKATLLQKWKTRFCSGPQNVVQKTIQFNKLQNLEQLFAKMGSDLQIAYKQ